MKKVCRTLTSVDAEAQGYRRLVTDRDSEDGVWKVADELSKTAKRGRRRAVIYVAVKNVLGIDRLLSGGYEFSIYYKPVMRRRCAAR